MTGQQSCWVDLGDPNSELVYPVSHTDRKFWEEGVLSVL